MFLPVIQYFLIKSVMNTRTKIPNSTFRLGLEFSFCVGLEPEKVSALIKVASGKFLAESAQSGTKAMPPIKKAVIVILFNTFIG